MILWELFLSFLKIGMFSFGGGYAALPLIQNEVIEQHHWLSIQDFTNLITISQMTPGPIAINSATFVGFRIAGFQGAIVATLGSITPAFFIVLSLAYLYQRYKKLNSLQYLLQGLRPTIVALIGTAGIILIRSSLFANSSLKPLVFTNVNWRMLCLIIMSFIAFTKTKWHPILIMLLTGLLNVLIVFIQQLL
ncbi:chromate transporter [Atopobacter phocae]|uniref:chromate transporter n=1 Tax=Atopobacter phocae TaxID=136492 RepID=UPI00047257A7|nr:chromate transporter [Atopobacter phocae]